MDTSSLIAGKNTGPEQIMPVQGWVNLESVNRLKFTSALIAVMDGMHSVYFTNIQC